MLPSSRALAQGPLVLLTVLLALGGCDSSPSTSADNAEGELDLASCTIPSGQIVFGARRDAIPALTNPPLVGPDAEGARYLADSSRVIGLLLGDTPLAVPHNILWHHEIVNLDDWAGRDIAVTYCPLTGSSLAFDRRSVNGAEFGGSGLLFKNNLMMYDRRKDKSLWPQMSLGARCGPRTGASLTAIPVIEMRWAQWRHLHPDTKVVSENTGYNRDYTPSGYPYRDYERLNNDFLLFEMPIDERRPPKERVLGLPMGRGMAFPFGELNEDSSRQVSEVTVGQTNAVVFWDPASRGAMAFHPTVDGQLLSFTVKNGAIVDTDTGSRWRLDGRAVEGPMEGTRLEPVDKAYVAFWFAWAAFFPKTRLWTNPS